MRDIEDFFFDPLTFLWILEGGRKKSEFKLTWLTGRSHCERTLLGGGGGAPTWFCENLFLRGRLREANQPTVEAAQPTDPRPPPNLKWSERARRSILGGGAMTDRLLLPEIHDPPEVNGRTNITVLLNILLHRTTK